jgi:competence protein ComFC
LKGKEREENIKNIFYINEKKLPDEIILFDDVITTGSTLKECAKLLRKNGVKEIYSISLARVV